MYNFIAIYKEQFGVGWIFLYIIYGHDESGVIFINPVSPMSPEVPGVSFDNRYPEILTIFTHPPNIGISSNKIVLWIGQQ